LMILLIVIPIPKIQKKRRKFDKIQKDKKKV
jgi:hypothetical protein